VGDTVIVTAGNKSSNTPQGVFFGSITSQGNVSIHLSANAAPVSFHTGTWRVTVIKP
jgi:hypothetical protein